MEEACDDCNSGRPVRCRPGVSCGVVGAVIAIIVFALSWDTVEPTEFGIVKNDFTGSVELDPDKVHVGGRYLIGIMHSFIKFPRHLVNLEFSVDGDQPPIPARTGPDPDDKESGGQPIGLSVSFQFRLERSGIPAIFRNYSSTGYVAFFLRVAKQSITNKAQSFTPREFWTRRREIEREMTSAVNSSLVAGGAVIAHLQLLRVDFNDTYENTITQIQLQEQLVVTKTYQYEVARVAKEVDVLRAETDASINKINAEAERAAAVAINQAEADALRLEQNTKASYFAQLKKGLGWSAEDFLKYMKIKSLAAQPSDSMVVGVSAMG